MIKVGFIGAGDIAYLHGEGVQASSNAQLHGIWNRTRAKAEEKARAAKEDATRKAKEVFKQTLEAAKQAVLKTQEESEKRILKCKQEISTSMADFDAKAKAKAERGLAKVEKQVRAADAKAAKQAAEEVFSAPAPALPPPNGEVLNA